MIKFFIISKRSGKVLAEVPPAGIHEDDWHHGYYRVEEIKDNIVISRMDLS